jgi:hypothetical protein
MSNQQPSSSLFVIRNTDGQSLLDATEQALHQHTSVLAQLPVLTNVALGDPYLAQQLAELHRTWEIQPRPGSGILARLRSRLAWWLLGVELQQINTTHATLVRLLDSLIVQLDQERAARRRIEEQLAYTSEQR